MRYPVITISRQYGSGASRIAALVAHQLGVPLYDRQILSRAAAEAGVTEETIAAAEQGRSFVSRMLESLGRYGVIAADVAPPADISSVELLYSSAQFRAVVEQVLQQVADTGAAVVVGHAAQMALKDRTDVLRVFLHAPMADRLRRLERSGTVTRAEARGAAERSDKERADFFRAHYHVNRYDVQLYDLTINTGQQTDEHVADLICAVAGR